MTIESQLEDAIRVLLDTREDGVSVSTAEAAKAVGGPRWRSLAVPARRAAHRMMQSGELEITQPFAQAESPAETRNAADLLRAKSPLRVRRPL